MAEFDQARLLAQLQDLPKQRAQRLQMPPAELRDGTEIRRIEPHNAHEIDAFVAGLGDAPRGVDAAAIGITTAPSSSRDQTAVAPVRAIARSDPPEIDLSDQAQNKTGEMVLRHEVLHLAGRNSGSSIFQARNVLLMRKIEFDSLFFGQQNPSNIQTGS